MSENLTFLELAHYLVSLENFSKDDLYGYAIFDFLSLQFPDMTIRACVDAVQYLRDVFDEI